MKTLPFPHDWSRPFIEEHEFKTRILSTRDHTEWRVAELMLPRRAWRITPRLTRGGLQTAQGLLARYHQEPMRWADELLYAEIAAPAASADTQIVLGAPWELVIADRAFFIRLPSGVQRRVVVDSVAGDDVTITLKEAVGIDVPAGSYLHAIRRVRLDPNQKINVLTGNVGRGDLRIIEDDQYVEVPFSTGLGEDDDGGGDGAPSDGSPGSGGSTGWGGETEFGDGSPEGPAGAGGTDNSTGGPSGMCLLGQIIGTHEFTFPVGVPQFDGYVEIPVAGCETSIDAAGMKVTAGFAYTIDQPGDAGATTEIDIYARDADGNVIAVGEEILIYENSADRGINLVQAIVPPTARYVYVAGRIAPFLLLFVEELTGTWMVGRIEGVSATVPGSDGSNGNAGAGGYYSFAESGGGSDGSGSAGDYTDPNSVGSGDGGDAGLVTTPVGIQYGIFSAPPNFNERINVDMDSLADEVRFDKTLAGYFITPRNDLGMRLGYTLFNRSAANGLVQFFTNMRGRQGAFLMPTWVDDFGYDWTSTAPANIVVPGGETAEFYAGNALYAHLYAEFKDGRKQFNRIVSISTDLNGDSVITLAAAWLDGFEPAAITRLCFAPAWRFASDRLAVEWLTDQVSRISFNVVALPYDGAWDDA